MKQRLLFATLALFTLPVAAGASLFGEDAPPPVSAAGAGFETAFSPSAEVAATIVKAIDSAKKSVRVAARLFTSKPVSEALFRARRAGRDVKVVLDGKSNGNGYSAALFLQAMSYPPHMTKGDSGLYSSYIVIDETDVIVGNIADLSDVDDEKKNASAVLVIHNSPELAKRYLANWQVLWNASEEMKQDKK